MPGMSSTTASPRPAIRLNRVDLPTFGRPTIATTGSLMSERIPPGRARQAAVARPSRVMSSRNTPSSFRVAGGTKTRSPRSRPESPRRMSLPVRRPATVTLRPKNSFAATDDLDLTSSRVRARALSTAARRVGSKNSPVTSVNPLSPFRTASAKSFVFAPEPGQEVPGHPDPVLELWEIIVVRLRRTLHPRRR